MAAAKVKEVESILERERERDYWEEMKDEKEREEKIA